MQSLPEPRGPLSAVVIAALAGRPGADVGEVDVRPEDPVGDDDLQLALYCCYERRHRAVPVREVPPAALLRLDAQAGRLPGAERGAAGRAGPD